MSYREVIPDQTLPDVWKEVTLNTGGTQSTLQDIKVAEKANGYSYKSFSRHHTSNRFIYWRINNDVLELVEQSLDVNLTGNKIRYRFIDTPILDGISIYETLGHVIILVPTVCSVHRLMFPHPDTLHRQVIFGIEGVHPDLTVASIFAEVSSSNARDSSVFNVFTNPSTTNSQLPQVATSLLTSDQEAIFVFGYPSAEILLVKQSPQGRCESIELKHDSFMPRFIYGIAEKFKHKVSDGHVLVSMVLHTFASETYALTLSRDGNLRVWSCAKGNCIAVTDIVSEIASLGQHFTHGSQNHLLKKMAGKDDSELTVVVFMSFSTECQFHVFKVRINNGQFKICRTNTLYSPGKDLVDFNLLSNHIWSMWRSEDGDTAVYNAVLCNDGGEGSHWIPATLEPIPDADFIPDMNSLDPRQAYLNHIFFPSRFPLSVISKALSIFKRSSILSDVSLSLSVLKQRVCLAVENEIQSELKEAEVSDEDYLECAYWCWAKFYSCCVQYHVAGLRPLGLLILSSASGVVLLKKSMYSFLRPHDSLEHMLMCSEYVSIENFANHPQLGEDMDVTDDVIKLMNVIVYLEQQLSDVFKYTFERELSQLKPPDVVMSELITEILTEIDDQFIWIISQKLNICKDIYQAMHKLLELLRIECVQVSDDDEMDGKYKDTLNYLFTSHLGVSLVNKCLHQQAVVRFTICRNLLVIQNILIEKGEREWNTLEAVRSVCLPEIVMLTQASYVILYLTELIALPVLPLESTMARLASLKLNPVFNLKANSMQAVTLVDYFISSTGGFEVRKMFSNLKHNRETIDDWNISLLSYTNLVMELLWPLSGDTIFAEWLLTSGQHIWLHQYVRLLNDWCEWNNSARSFLLAVSLLSTGEHHKAQNFFGKAVKGIFSDQFLMKQILNIPGSEDEKKAYVLYYLKVIHLFDLHGARDCAISIANTALSIADIEDPHVATLYSIKFIHHLALHHYDQAYDAINANPDIDRMRDNIRDFAKTLLDQNELDKLLSYSYANLDPVLFAIIAEHARAADPMNNIYYDFLYAFCIKRGMPLMRLAASQMYEQAWRLQDYNSVEALEKQVKCYLASLNALHLYDERFQWVVKPLDPNEKPKVEEIPVSADSEVEPEKIELFDFEVLGVSDIRKDLELASARFRLIRYDPRYMTNSLKTPTEVVRHLCKAGIFKHALILCKMYGLKYDPIFDALTKQCLILSHTEDLNAWNWLIENDLHDLNFVGNTPSVVAWQLLRTYLNQYEEKQLTVLHKVVCRKIIEMKRIIPHFITISYKLKNAPELLRLYFFAGRLDEATTLACDHILAILGYGKEHFGYKHSLTPITTEYYLPVQVIHWLIKELSLHKKRKLSNLLRIKFEKLKKLFGEYNEAYARVKKLKAMLPHTVEPPKCITVT
ncbi:hypothetical protein FQA39_LY01302 [Lamprigera yunnana]|nr:hypothetical protein FQA39_LY01302 [Lamprigera yunnana]